MATYKYDGKQWIGYNEYDTALEIVQKSKNNILYLDSLHNTGMVEEELQQIRNQINEVRNELVSLEMRTDSIEETLPLKQDELSAGLAIGIYGTTIAVKLQDIAEKLDSVPTGSAITPLHADLIRVENKLYYKTETSVGGMIIYAYEELTNSELTERIVAQIPTDFKIDDTGRLILVHDSNVIGTGVEIGGIGVTIDAPATATQGTLTSTQLGILEASETNYLMFNHEKYYLMDKQHTSGSLTYSHVGADNQINHIKTFTITLTNLTWILIDTEVGKSEPAITIVNELPEANEENFEKGKIYTTGELLQYISKVALSEGVLSLANTLTRTLQRSSAAAVGTDIYIFGGQYTDYTNSQINTIYKYSTTTNTISTMSSTLPRALINTSAAAVGTDIYIFGGQSGSSKYQTIYKYSTTTDVITTMSSTLPQVLASTSAAAVGTDIYIFGGQGSSNVNTIYKYSTTTDVITTMSSTLPQAIYGTSAAAVGTDIYIFGGRSSSGAVKTIYKYSTTTGSITTMSNTLPEILSGTSAAAVGTDIYIFGGFSSAIADTIYKYSTTTNTISTMSSTLPQVLANTSAAAVGTDIYIFGGITTSGTVANTIYNYKLGYEYTFKTISTQ